MSGGCWKKLENKERMGVEFYGDFATGETESDAQIFLCDVKT